MSKKVVVPGDLVSAERKRLGSNVFVSDGKVYSKVLGISDDEGEVASVVALEGKYNPQVQDTIVGVVGRVVFAGYGININSYTESFMPKSSFREELKVGDIIVATINYVNELKEADLEYAKKMYGGEIIEVTPVRTPRLIGKNGSMLELIRRGTGTEIIIGKNGRVWTRGGNIPLLKKVVKFIEENSYKSNLTNTIEAFFGVLPPEAGAAKDKKGTTEESEVMDQAQENEESDRFNTTEGE
ncbi:MAG: KH domain-containing protein [archaeon]